MGDTAGLVTFSIETEELRPAIARTREIAECFASATRDPLPEAAITAAGYEVARAAIRLLASELDDHEQRVVEGLGNDARVLQEVVDRYRQTEAASVNAATRTATHLPRLAG